MTFDDLQEVGRLCYKFDYTESDGQPFAQWVELSYLDWFMHHHPDLKPADESYIVAFCAHRAQGTACANVFTTPRRYWPHIPWDRARVLDQWTCNSRGFCYCPTHAKETRCGY